MIKGREEFTGKVWGKHGAGEGTLRSTHVLSGVVLERTVLLETGQELPRG